jgi:predicted amidohydrolase
MLKIALAQFQPKLYDKTHNFKIVEKTVRKTDADILIFGELFLTGYINNDTIINVAEHINGKISNRLQKLAEKTGMDILIGLPEASDIKGVCYNSAVVYLQDGNVKVYRKVQLANFGPFEEKLFFKCGTKLDVFKTNKAKIGILICYDIFFPELAKIYALKGADMIICISASPSATRKFFEKVIVARAIENATFIVYANLVGLQGNLTFWGGSTIIDPRGNAIVKGDAYVQKLINGTVDLAYLKTARHFRPTIRDTNLNFMKILKEIE